MARMVAFSNTVLLFHGRFRTSFQDFYFFLCQLVQLVDQAVDLLVVAGFVNPVEPALLAPSFFRGAWKCL